MNPRRRRERNALRQLNKSTAYVPAPELKVVESSLSNQPEIVIYLPADEDIPDDFNDFDPFATEEAVEPEAEKEVVPEAQETHTEPVLGKKGRRGRR